MLHICTRRQHHYDMPHRHHIILTRNNISSNEVLQWPLHSRKRVCRLPPNEYVTFCIYSTSVHSQPFHILLTLSATPALHSFNYARHTLVRNAWILIVLQCLDYCLGDMKDTQHMCHIFPKVFSRISEGRRLKGKPADPGSPGKRPLKWR